MTVYLMTVTGLVLTVTGLVWAVIGVVQVVIGLVWKMIVYLIGMTGLGADGPCLGSELSDGLIGHFFHDGYC